MHISLIPGSRAKLGVPRAHGPRLGYPRPCYLTDLADVALGGGTFLISAQRCDNYVIVNSIPTETLFPKQMG